MLKIDSNTKTLGISMLFFEEFQSHVMSVLIKLQISHFKLTVLALTYEKIHLLQSCKKEYKIKHAPKAHHVELGQGLIMILTSKGYTIFQNQLKKC